MKRNSPEQEISVSANQEKANTSDRDQAADLSRKQRLLLWAKRLGFAGFTFFLLKGLVWIAIFIGLGKCAL